MQIKSHLLRHFGVQPGAIYADNTSDVIVHELAEGIRAKGLIALTGKSGSGKTFLLRQALDRLDGAVSVVRVADMSPRRAELPSVLSAIAYDLSNETPKHTMEARSRQALRLMHQHTVLQQRPVVIVVEDAHRFHAASLNELKLLREGTYANHSHLCGIVLLGWAELEGKIKHHTAVRLRTEVVSLDRTDGYMGHEQRVAYLDALYGYALTGGVREILAARCETPEEMNGAVADAMQRAYYAGLHGVDETIVPPTSEQASGNGISQRQIAKASGLSPATVNRVLNGGGSPDQRQKVADAYQHLGAPAGLSLITKAA
ncbi:MAG: AAA family ATPase [Rhodothermales bacterium]|nr:AAA family ATPase [Rhodothermales bacterium]